MNCKYYKLIYEGDFLYLDDEPVQWDSVEMTLKRDPDWHGVNYEYSGNEIRLEFDCVAGADFIDEIYTNQGLDAEIILEYGFVLNEIEEMEFQGRLVLSEFRRFKGRVSCNVERKTLQDIVKARFDIKADLFSKLSADGDDLTPPTLLNIPFHSKNLNDGFYKKAENQTATEGIAAHSSNHRSVYCYFDTADDKSPLREKGLNSRTPFSILSTVTGQPEPVLTSEADASYKLDLKLNYSLSVYLSWKGGWFTGSDRRKLKSHMFSTVIAIKNKNGAWAQAGPPIVHSTGLRDGKGWHDFTGSVNITGLQISLNQGDQLYIHGLLSYQEDGQTDQIEYRGRCILSEIRLSGQSTAPETTAKGMMVHEAVDRSLAFITGKDSLLLSDFLGRPDLGYPLDGCGSQLLITNGFQIRNFKEDRPVQVSAKTLLESLKAIYCIGLGYELDEDGNERIRVERIEHFFRDKEILEITDPADYEEESAGDFVHNKIDVGYAKFPEEGDEILDEFNTRHEYTTPVRRHDNKLSIVSELIASGYAIEMTRREQFGKDGIEKKSTKYDDDIFVVCVDYNGGEVPIFTFGPTSIIGSTSSVSFYVPVSKAIAINTGDQIRVSSPENTGTFLITSVNMQPSTVSWNGEYSFHYMLIVEGILSTEYPVDAGFQLISAGLVTERAEAFDIKPGTLEGSETAYNLRLSPKRMLLNWSFFINGGLMYKDSSERLKNTFVKQNGDLTTTMVDTDPCNLGDTGHDELREGDDVLLGSFGERNQFYIPDWVMFNARLEWEQVDRLRKAMTNRSLEDDNYGYITVVNPNGDKVSGWIYEMRWSPVSEKVFFKLLKYKLSLHDAPDQENCQDYADWTFQDFEDSDIGTWIENCRFEDFN